ncbi:MAG TPA: alpha/beta hydrolase domain-containing protein [Bryobacteraceae bacterium]|nr:alpha/beta hydrolase domain-containing protein [Bryobacteraceae bacterium]
MPTKTARIVSAAIALLSASVSVPLQARVTRIVIEHRDSPAYQGQPFGQAGPYERLTGHFYGELDPKDPLNAIITDLALAPRNSRGRVEYSATFSLAKPADLGKTSGVLIYEVPNRGRAALAAGATNAGAMADLFKHGHVLLSSGWQGDIPPAAGLETLVVPIARNPDGSSITGPVLARFVDMRPGTTTLPLTGGLGAGVPMPLPASLDTSKARLTRRAGEGRADVPVRSSDWAFADCTKTPFPGEADPHKVCLKGGFDPAFLYELVYTAKDPLVLGIGYAATRDLNSFFRYATADDTGAPNPLAGKISFAIGRGTSQSGNYLRSFIHLGFNQDESKRIVLDGANPNIAARQNPMNFRFAVPGGAADLYQPGSDGIVWWGDYADEARHQPAGGLLDRCNATKTCPKIFETFGSSEFWGLRASPDLVGTRADRDIPLPANVRRYYFPGVTHGGGRGGFSTATPNPPARCELPDNPNPSSDTMRALTEALVDWVVKGAAPPASQYPRFDRGELAPPVQAALGSPVIPGVPLPDGILNPLYNYDFGPKFNVRDLSGAIAIQPPVIKDVLPSLVPKVNSDGNETAGVASVLHQVPLATYLGWNVTASGYYKGTECGFTGGYVPFAKTKAERLAAGDPRPSLEERYGTHEKYVTLVRAAAARLVKDRYLLQADADRLIAEAESSNILR